MAADPLSKYRSQNGITEAGSYDPQVVAWIKQAAAETGADPSALLATSLMESGAQRGRIGDNGTSYGPFQFHRHGALGNHTPQWANSYAAVLNRAQEFGRLKVHGGVGAAAVQGPLDKVTYAAGVNGLLARANAILGRTPQPGAPTPQGLAPNPPRADLTRNPIRADGATVQRFVDALFDPSVSASELATLGSAFTPSPTGGTGTALPPSAPGAPPVAHGKVVAGAAKIIGTPYAGTHTLGNWESDNAVDIALPKGTPVYAAADGTIGSQFGALTSSKSSRFAGLRVHLKTNGNEFYYAHLSRTAVRPGESVKKGQLIGYSGEANGVSHLHLGVLNGKPQAFA